MPSSNSRKRVTVVASAEGIEKAERALIRLGFESKSNFAESQLLARNAVTKFFQRNPIQLDTFKRICSGLHLKWDEILESDAMDVSNQDAASHSEPFSGGISTIVQREESMQPITRQVTVVNQQQEVQAVIVLQGDITSISRWVELSIR
jgi:predicted NACHT family NTPase